MDERILNVLVRASDDKRKPICVIAVGGEYTDRFRKVLDNNNVPTYGSPNSAVKDLKKLIDYAKYREQIKRK
jgi:acyl-CoA synthetase (NDP forming)